MLSRLNRSLLRSSVLPVPGLASTFGSRAAYVPTEGQYWRPDLPDQDPNNFIPKEYLDQRVEDLEASIEFPEVPVGVIEQHGYGYWGLSLFAYAMSQEIILFNDELAMAALVCNGFFFYYVALRQPFRDFVSSTTKDGNTMLVKYYETNIFVFKAIIEKFSIYGSKVPAVKDFWDAKAKLLARREFALRRKSKDVRAKKYSADLARILAFERDLAMDRANIVDIVVQRQVLQSMENKYTTKKDVDASIKHTIQFLLGERHNPYVGVKEIMEAEEHNVRDKIGTDVDAFSPGALELVPEEMKAIRNKERLFQKLLDSTLHAKEVKL